MCEYKDAPGYGGHTCEDLFNCCSCGGVDCGCRYCYDCNACEECASETDRIDTNQT